MDNSQGEQLRIDTFVPDADEQAFMDRMAEANDIQASDVLRGALRFMMHVADRGHNAVIWTHSSGSEDEIGYRLPYKLQKKIKGTEQSCN